MTLANCQIESTIPLQKAHGFQHLIYFISSKYIKNIYHNKNSSFSQTSLAFHLQNAHSLFMNITFYFSLLQLLLKISMNLFHFDTIYSIY